MAQSWPWDSHIAVKKKKKKIIRCCIVVVPSKVFLGKVTSEKYNEVKVYFENFIKAANEKSFTYICLLYTVVQKSSCSAGAVKN